jgi:negative regulator of genetic competence, sporulation and motility
MIEEFTREEVVRLALDAGFSRHEVMNGITKFERLMRVVVKEVNKEEDFDMDGRC